MTNDQNSTGLQNLCLSLLKTGATFTDYNTFVEMIQDGYSSLFFNIKISSMDWEIRKSETVINICVQDELFFLIINESTQPVIKNFDQWRDSTISVEYQAVWLAELAKISLRLQEKIEEQHFSKTKLPKDDGLRTQVFLSKVNKNPESFADWHSLKELEAFLELALDMKLTIYCFAD